MSDCDWRPAQLDNGHAREAIANTEAYRVRQEPLERAATRLRNLHENNPNAGEVPDEQALREVMDDAKGG